MRTKHSKRAIGITLPFILIPFLALVPPGSYGQITLEEVAQHMTDDDCWSAVYGEVYDVTVYAPTHPNPSVYTMCGKEATVMFDAVHGDTPTYMDIFPGIDYLGTLVEATPPPTSLAPTDVPTTKPTLAPTTTAPTEPLTTPAPTKPPMVETPGPTDAPMATSSPDASILGTPVPSSGPPSPSSGPGTLPPVPGPTITAAAAEQVPLVELALHNTPGDCWVALQGNVYEFTYFLRLHPGGAALLSPCCGLDCTAAFDDQHDLDILKTYGKYYLVAPLENVISEEELTGSNTPENCLINYFGRVFNVTAYANGINTPEQYTISKSLAKVNVNDVPCGSTVSLEQFASLSPGISNFHVGALEGAFGQLPDIDHSASPQPVQISTGSISINIPTGSPANGVPAPPVPTPVTAPLPAPTPININGLGNGPITAAQLAQHSSADDCWSVYFGEVFDLTSYSHPGGQSFITSFCGGDGTSGFQGIQHPQSYMDMVIQHLVGTYVGGPVPEPTLAPVPAPAPPLAATILAPPVPTGTPVTAPVPAPTTANTNGVGNVPISAAQLAQHASGDDCWSVYFGEVYDLTSYSHPGGQSFITNFCGGDGMSGFQGIQHPQSYMDMVTQHWIGTYAGGPAPAPTPVTSNSGVAVVGGGTITAAELAQHSSSGDCWVAYFGEVYDVTSYAPNHPAGSGRVTNDCGRDGTTGFSSAHGPGTLGAISNSKLGTLAGYTGPSAGSVPAGGYYDSDSDSEDEDEDEDSEDEDEDDRRIM